MSRTTNVEEARHFGRDHQIRKHNFVLSTSSEAVLFSVRWRHRQHTRREYRGVSTVDDAGDLR